VIMNALVWKEILEEASKNIPAQYFLSFLKPIQFQKFEQGTFYISAPSVLVQSHIESRYLEILRTATLVVTGEPFTISFSADAPSASFALNETLQSSFQSLESDLNPEFTFERFLISDSNRLAAAAAKSIVENEGKFNPLYVFGPVGVGKTHLLHAIGNKIKLQDPWKSIKYVDSLSFLNEFVFTVRQNNRTQLESFKMKYQSFNVLLFDDVQFLNGSAEKTQEEFFGIFNFLFERRRQIVLASDRPSSELPLHDRLKSRFVHGLQVDVKSHDYSLRKAILSYHASVYGIAIERSTLDWIAEQCTGDARTMIGIMNDIVLYKKAYDIFVLSDDKIRSIAETRIAQTKKKIGYTAEEILEFLSFEFQIPRKDLLGKNRKSDLVRVRHIGMLVLHQLLALPKTQIGRLFGVEHSTVIHAISKMENLMQKDPDFRNQIQKLKEKISFQ